MVSAPTFSNHAQSLHSNFKNLFSIILHLILYYNIKFKIQFLKQFLDINSFLSTTPPLGVRKDH